MNTAINMINNIVAVLSSSESEERRVRSAPSIVQARHLARRAGCGLTLLAFDPSSTEQCKRRPSASGSAMREGGEGEIHRVLSDLAQHIGHQDGISVTVEVRSTEPSAKAVIEWLEEVPVDLLIVGNEPTAGAVDATGLTRLIHEISTPIWFANSTASPREGVVAAIAREYSAPLGQALNSLDHDVLEAARDIGNLFHADLHVVQAYKRTEPILSLVGSLPGSPQGQQIDAREKGVREAERALERLARATGVDGAQIIVARGEVCDVVTERADALDVGLIVMGAISSECPWETTLGDGTVEGMLGSAPCDVLFVKPTENRCVVAEALRVGNAEPPAQRRVEAHEVDLLVDPADRFAGPRAVLQADWLSTREKILILQCWREELEAERCGPHEPQRDTTGDVLGAHRQLHELRGALAQLGIGGARGLGAAA